MTPTEPCWNLAVLSGNRADYGLVTPLLACLAKDRQLNPLLLLTGTQQSQEFACRQEDVRRAGIEPAAVIGLPDASGSHQRMALSLADATRKFTLSLEALAPDVLILLGDRFESFAAAQAAYCLGIPIAHIHGGELTQGALDEGFRHCITKLSYWHFAAAPDYAQRIIQLGETPRRVWNVGPLCADHLMKGKTIATGAIEKQLGVGLSPHLLIGTLHPETAEKQSAADMAKAYAEAISQFLKAHPEALLVQLKSNQDAGGKAINKTLEALAKRWPQNITLQDFLPPEVFAALLHRAQLIVGNSSSGVVEAPMLGKASVTVGTRQKGRLNQPGIFYAGHTPSQIVKAMEKAWRAPPGKSRLTGAPSQRIASLLKQQLKQGRLASKQFYDLGRRA